MHALAWEIARAWKIIKGLVHNSIYGHFLGQEEI